VTGGKLGSVAEVFLSYLEAEDRHEAERIAELLKKSGFSVWLGNGPNS
jgi:hypothetical protein